MTRDPLPARRVLLANPRGFCAGVVRAIEAVEQTIARHGAPVHVRHRIVHNQAVIDRLERLGARFVEEVGDIPPGDIAILSAHGVAPSVRRDARARGLRLIDATCPLVAKVHGDVAAHHAAGRHVILIGHAGHPEITGTLGQVPTGAISLVTRADDVAALPLAAATPVAYAVQTTFSVRDSAAIVAAIVARFPDMAGPRAGNICYATTNRQAAIEAIAARSDAVLVVGDPLSSNAGRLVEVARAAGCARSMLVRDGDDVDPAMLVDARTIGVTAAASTPERAVRHLCERLAAAGFAIMETDGVEEKAAFRPVPLDPD
ncbi:(E)-4-hydroxy-3-methyl-but-2-enyl pyrophosphate reductase [Sphingobium sp. OAS761]|uniref:4-hydroxy-3-methylbut-2-enyl diphosphate reductase n=1 Tax=Sphingobium sp. OAS761 TaxID=2817901 RepID=UPI0020A1527D|nr:4-hydroxy-3-methylbut-2-enyl diphosphate reductase [Sphingobium sp. OAS761]MCP1469093.1 (E)-4-hydroxy-3-methyl-but-2-enyl pyrophosphate reductase [Sphingobium sp. OAS761]